MKRGEKKQSRRLTWFVCREFTRDCWGRRFCFEFPLNSFCLCSLLYSFHVSLFQLVFLRLYALFSEHHLSLSLGWFSLSFFLSQNWWGKPISSMGVLEMKLKIVCFACVSLLFRFLSSLSPSLTDLSLRCCSVYIVLGGLITGGRLTVGHH
jgi:hypothetical protein